jgi:hypothetical protein
MTRLRRLAVVLAALAVVGVTVPTGGFTSASAERGVSVDVVPDDEAFLGVEVKEVGGSDDRKAISFVGFCTDTETDRVGAEANVTKYKQEVTPRTPPTRRSPSSGTPRSRCRRSC